MIGSVKDQNKQLQSAGKKPVDTTPRRIKADSFSAKVASAGPKNEAQDHVKTEDLNRSNKKQIKASYEGLMYSPSAVLQFNGVGYDRKSNQSARYLKDTSKFSGKTLENPFNSGKNYSILNNYSGMTKKNSSSFRMNNIVKTNMSFK